MHHTLRLKFNELKSTCFDKPFNYSRYIVKRQGVVANRKQFTMTGDDIHHGTRSDQSYGLITYISYHESDLLTDLQTYSQTYLKTFRQREL